MSEEISGTTTTAYHYHYDGNGNVTEVTDSSGNSAATYRYDAFGNTLVSTGTYATTNKYRFSTKPIDSEIATAPLYYYGYRYYDPITGRWPSRDPIEERGGVNLYGFVGNNGVNRMDILGNSWLTPPNATRVFTLALISIPPQYKAALGRCHNTLLGCQQNCGWVSIEASSLATAAYASCNLAATTNPLYIISCKTAFIAALKKIRQMDDACNDACKIKKCCYSDVNPSHYGDPSAFVITIP
jgi:RHS repeat-associated protein